MTGADEKRERVPAEEDSLSSFVRRAVQVRAVRWTGSNLDEMEALLGLALYYNPGDGDGFDASVRTSRHSAWREVYPGDWAVVEGERIAVVEADEFAEQYAPGTLEFEWRVGTPGSSGPLRDEAECRGYAKDPDTVVERRAVGSWERVERF